MRLSIRLSNVDSQLRYARCLALRSWRIIREVTRVIFHGRRDSLSKLCFVLSPYSDINFAGSVLVQERWHMTRLSLPWITSINGMQKKHSQLLIQAAPRRQMILRSRLYESSGVHWMRCP